MLSHRAFARIAAERAVIWVRADLVTRHSGTKWPVTRRRLARLRRVLPAPVVSRLRSALRQYEPLLIPRADFGTATDVRDTQRYRRVADFMHHRDDPQNALWYRDLAEELAQDGLARHKQIEMRSHDEILAFLTGYVGVLIDDLAANGFSPEHGGYESTAVVDADGAICKSGSGNHRFNIAHALGLKRFPLRIVGLHEDFVLERHGTRRVDTEALISDLAEVEAAHRD